MNWNQISTFYTDLNTLSLSNHWSNLEFHFFQLAEQYFGSGLAKLIRSAKLDDYSSLLNNFVTKEFIGIRGKSVKAIYFEYDLDNSWKSNLFFYDNYSPISNKNDEWASHWLFYRLGSNLPEFARLYKHYGGFRIENDSEIGVTFFLVARTVAAFGRVIEGVPKSEIAICIGHHDQDEVTRIHE